MKRSLDEIKHENSVMDEVNNENENYDTEMPDENGSAQKRRRSEGDSHVDCRILLASKNAGAIIGKGGANIKRLRTDYKASVTVPDSGGPERILSIGASLATVTDILMEVIPTLEEYQQYKDLDFDAEIRLLVHQSQAGCIIGRSGFKIKELRESTGAAIKVYSQCLPSSTERVVQLNGRPKVVIECLEEIYDLLQQAPPKGHNNPYDPNNYDEFYAHEYGGFTMETGRGSRGRNRGMGSRMRGGGNGGAVGGGIGGGGGDGIVRNVPPISRGSLMGMRTGGGGMGRGGNMRGNFGGDLNGAFGGRGMGQNFAQDTMGMGNQGMMFGGSTSGTGANSTTQVSIPKELAGAIIGKGGSRIRQIRNDSGAGITIDEALPGSTDRIITISGSQEQIRNAQYLLQMSVKEHSGKY